MEEKKIFVTKEGLDELKAEYEKLVHVTREEVIEELKAARAQGDLSENADYDAARDRQSRVEARIKELEYMIKNSEIIKTGNTGSEVKIGSTVEIEELDTGDKSTYEIVGTTQADPLNGKLSNETPLAEAILGQKVGSVCTVDVDNPYDVKILKIK